MSRLLQATFLLGDTREKPLAAYLLGPTRTRTAVSLNIKMSYFGYKCCTGRGTAKTPANKSGTKITYKKRSQFTEVQELPNKHWYCPPTPPAYKHRGAGVQGIDDLCLWEVVGKAFIQDFLVKTNCRNVKLWILESGLQPIERSWWEVGRDWLYCQPLPEVGTELRVVLISQ